jgi:hypothetical protein
MKEPIRKILPVIAFGLFVGLMAACKGGRPELTGKWSGSSDLATQLSRAPGSTQLHRTNAVPIQVTLTLNQNGGGLTGDASVTISGKPAVHLPITAGVVDQGCKVSLEADRSGFSNVHLSFDGRAAAGQIAGDVALKMDTFLGVAENKGPIRLIRIG